jgi:hypothetical protein
MKYFQIKILTILIFSINSLADSFEYNSYNNHGVVGLINMPTARFFNESVYGLTIYDGTPDKKMTATSNPFNWLEASFFYMKNSDQPYCTVTYDPVCKQSHKDKGFNVKLRIKEQGVFPAIAIGAYDVAGTGYYTSEYLVASYGVSNIDFHLGLGWGELNGSRTKIKNPFIYLNDEFKNRERESDLGGRFQSSAYFSSEQVSPFFGISYALNEKIIINLETDTRLTPGRIGHEIARSEYSYGIDYKLNKNFLISISNERDSYFTFRFTYKSDPKTSVKKYEYKEAETNDGDSKYTKLIKNLEENGIGINKITESANSIGLELTQFVHPNLGIIEEIISSSARDAGINKNIKKDLRVADLNALSEIDDAFKKSSELIYERKKTSSFNTKTGLKFRPFLASREEFFKGALLLENDSEYVIKDNFSIHTNIKYSIADNFDDLIYPAATTFPAQVRSDVKDYLKNMDGVLIGRAQLEYLLTPKKNHHLMFTAGILEDMFSGYGFEYMYFKQGTNYAIGAEIFDVEKRDYNWGFGTLDYQNTIGSVDLYFRNYGLIPFDLKFSVGEYLAGDTGATLDISRSFQNGTKFGIFASSTDVTASQYGEGSFDKGVYFNIPIYGNFINYAWRPLTKDPAAKLTRRQTLHDLLVKFREIN